MAIKRVFAGIAPNTKTGTIGNFLMTQSRAFDILKSNKRIRPPGVLGGFLASNGKGGNRMGLFDFFKSKQQRVKFDVAITTNVIGVESILEEGCNISKLNLGGYVSPSGGYMNWAIFDVVGTNPETGRKKARKYEAVDEAEALELAEKDGLLNPEIKGVIPHEPPTEKQIEYLKSWNVEVPEGACKSDISAILSRLVDSENEPKEDYAMFAHKMGIGFSKYIGAEALHNAVVFRLKDRDKAAFFAYCVQCNREGIEIGSMLDSPILEKLYAFGDKVADNESIMRSIVGRSPNDYLYPHKGSVAYKAVAEFFGF